MSWYSRDFAKCTAFSINTFTLIQSQKRDEFSLSGTGIDSLLLLILFEYGGLLLVQFDRQPLIEPQQGSACLWGAQIPPVLVLLDFI